MFEKAETEELARKVEALTAENMALRSELNQLNEKSDKLRGANATLLVSISKHQTTLSVMRIMFNLFVLQDKLNSSELEKRESGDVLPRVKNSDKNKNQGENDSNSASKLHQLLDTKPRAGAVAAG